MLTIYDKSALLFATRINVAATSPPSAPYTLHRAPWFPCCPLLSLSYFWHRMFFDELPLSIVPSIPTVLQSRTISERRRQTAQQLTRLYSVLYIQHPSSPPFFPSSSISRPSSLPSHTHLHRHNSFVWHLAWPVEKHSFLALFSPFLPCFNPPKPELAPYLTVSYLYKLY